MVGGSLLRALLAAAAIGALVLVPARTAVVPPVQQPAAVLIFAAASLQTALDELTPAVARAIGMPVRTSYAASSALARQIEAGAPADVFISADIEWMDYVATRGLIRADSRVNLLGNRLVLVAPASRTGPATKIEQGFPLARTLGNERLAVADPVTVPAGKYARAALMSLGVWDSVAAKLAPAENVRAALLLVSRGETPLGIVYATDAAADRGVAVVGEFPASTHPPIVYPAALTSVSSPAAVQVLAFLRGTVAAATFTRQGFSISLP